MSGKRKHSTELIQALNRISDGRSSRQGDTHTFHSFPARMPLSVAEALIETTPANSIVLDPMVGSGTTLIAAAYCGRRALGFDLDPLAVLITTAAVQPIAERKARDCSTRIRHAKDVLGFSPETADFVDYWFPKRSQKELAALAAVISRERNSTLRKFLWSVFSSIVIKWSSCKINNFARRAVILGSA
jgi:hypothetical protein